MPLLDNGNTEFATAVTRSWRPHYKSAELDRLEAALLAVHNNAANGAMLQTLYRRLREWIVKHPKEFGKRGSLVGQLVYQIERRAQALGISVLYEAGWFRMLTMRHNVHMWTPLQDLRAALAGHNADWLIRVTDIPIGPGLYQHTAEDRYALEDRAAALGELGPVLQPQNDRRFWLRLGRHVMTPRADGHRYGRCYSCASAVIHTLVADAAFDNYMIEHVASTNYDHHLVLVGRSNADGVSNAGLADGWVQWKWNTIVVDAWQANIPPANTHFANLAHQNQYAQSPLTWYCAYTPANRAADRAFAAALGALVRVAPQPAMVAAARLGVQAQGRATRNARGPRGGWIIEEEIAPGVWQEVIGGGG